MFHVLEFGGDDNAVMVPAIARPDADQLIGLGIDEGNAAGEPLEAAEHPHHVFAVVGNGQGLHVRPDALDFLLDLPRTCIDDHDPAAGGRGVEDREVELGAVHGKDHVERVGILAPPQRVFDVSDLLPVARIGIA